MATDSDRLTGFERVVGLHVALHEEMEGWDLTVWHKHLAGTFGDCPSEHYEGLQLAEVLDVLEAAVCTIGHGQSL